MKGRVTIRCPECRAWHPSGRKTCEGYDRTRKIKTGCGKNLKSLQAREYWIEFHVNGKRRRERIGLNTGPGIANTELSKRQIELDEGKYREPRKNLNFGVLAEDCWKRHISKAKTSTEYRRILDVEILPKWQYYPSHQIAKRDVLALLEPVMERGAPIMSNRVLTLLKIIFNWACEKDLLEVNPTYRMKPVAKERSRERVLTDSEIHTFWHGVEDPKVGPALRQALRMILVTGQRPGEVAGARIKDMDLQKGEYRWTLPDTKGARSHTIPLSPLALEIILSQPREEEQEFLFTTREGKHINEKSLPHAINKVPSLAKMDFTAHDLRRTVGTKLAEMGVPVHTISRIMNHSEGGVTKIYNRYSYDQEKREALNTWGEKLRNIISGTGTKEKSGR